MVDEEYGTIEEFSFTLPKSKVDRSNYSSKGSTHSSSAGENAGGAGGYLASSES